MRRAASAYTAVRSEGALLPPELLERVAQGDRELPGLRPADYHLGGSERINEQISRSWSRLLGVWTSFAPRLLAMNANDPGTGATRERWLAPLFQELGFGRLEPARGLEVDGKPYPISHRWREVPIHLVGAGVDLDRRERGVAGAARMSPHALVQRYLNRSEALWGILSNGRLLRLLRDNASLTRQAFLEFDLEAIFEGELYSDFALLWLVCHQSRFEGDPQERCLLERWREAADRQGARALEGLRDGVERAIRALGTGFLAHPGNAGLRERLRSGALEAQDYYRQLLRLVYRLIFLFTAEDRGLLHRPEADEAVRGRYARYYSTARLRRLAGGRRGWTKHPDLYEGLKVVLAGLGNEEGCPELALPYMGSFLFSPQACPDLDGAALANGALLEAVRALAFSAEGKVLRPVDYRNLGSEELGSVYESLLELHPEIDLEAAAFDLATAAGHERKTTGSYYTPTPLVGALLDSALEPALEEAAGKPDPERAILDLKVLDPACGSGHFLVAAAHRIAHRLAALRTGEEEPSPEAYRRALRDVVSRCLYGIDVNPMAVELCKVSLWLEAVDPGRPLSFLEHHIVCGNSLLGTTPRLLAGGIPDEAFTALEGDDKEVVKALRKRNRAERRGQEVLALGPGLAGAVERLAEVVRALEDLPTEGPEDLRLKEAAWERLQRAREAAYAKLVADAWCAAFVMRKAKGAPVLTDGVLRQLVQGPDGGDPRLREGIRELAERYRFLHPHLAFPQVLRLPADGEEPENPEAGWSGGFDVVIGNPPWDTLSPDTKEFFGQYEPAIRFKSKDEQDQILSQLLQHPGIAADWERHRRNIYSMVHFLKSSGRYRSFAPGNLGKGDFNVYRMFVELALLLTRWQGWVSQVAPAGLYGGANAAALRRRLFDECELRRVIGFVNTGQIWFDGVADATRFCLYAARKGGRTDRFTAAFSVASPDALAVAMSEPPLSMPVTIVREFSPDALAIMEIASQFEVDIVEKMYARWPKFGDAAAVPPSRHYMRELDMGNDRRRFVDAPPGLPLYEGRMVDRYDYRAKGYRSGRGRAAVWEPLPFDRCEKSIEPQWWVPEERLPAKVRSRVKRYRIGFCDATSPSNERTLIAALIPPGVVCGHKVPTILFDESYEWAYMLWLAVANSFVMDFLARKKVALSMSYTVLDSLPFPRVSRDHPLARELVPLALRLSCTGPEMSGYWNAMAARGWVEGPVGAGEEPPGLTDRDMRSDALARIDAIVALRGFGLTRHELAYILDSFPVVRRRDEAAYGEYRTKRIILGHYDSLSTGPRGIAEPSPAPAGAEGR